MESRTLSWACGDAGAPAWILFLGDTHIGARDVDRKLLERTLRLAAGVPSLAVALMGDFCDAISRGDSRFLAEGVDKAYPAEAFDDLPMWQMNDFFDLIQPIQQKVIAACKGNHDDKSAKRGDVSLWNELWRRLKKVSKPSFADSVANGAADLQYIGVLRIVFKPSSGPSRERTLFLAHGTFHGKAGSVASKLETIIHQYGVDAAVVGHGHTPVAIHVDRVDARQGVAKPAVGVMIPSWRSAALRKGWGAWEESRGFLPKTHGPALMRIIPATGRMDVFFGRQAVEELEEAQA